MTLGATRCDWVRPVRLGATAALLFVLAASLSASEPSTVAAAAQARDVATVRALLKSGADVNAAQGDGMTALHWASLNGDRELASMLLYAGANWRATTRMGAYLPLHLAAQSGADAVVDLLIAAGSDVAARTTTGATALMLASAAGNTKAVELLLAKGADLNAKESAHGQTALMFAAAADRADVTRVLLSRGADPSLSTTIIDLEKLTAAPGEDALQQSQQQRQQQGGGGNAAAPPPAALDVAGV